MHCNNYFNSNQANLHHAVHDKNEEAAYYNRNAISLY